VRGPMIQRHQGSTRCTPALAGPVLILTGSWPPTLKRKSRWGSCISFLEVLKEPGVVAHTCNPGNWEVEAGGM
jgi:hypothetical protein